jgi:hypothetical protein
VTIDHVQEAATLLDLIMDELDWAMEGLQRLCVGCGVRGCLGCRPRSELLATAFRTRPQIRSLLPGLLATGHVDRVDEAMGAFIDLYEAGLTQTHRV